VTPSWRRLLRAIESASEILYVSFKRPASAKTTSVIQVPSVLGIYIVSVPKGFEHKFLPESPVLPRRQVASSKSVDCLEKKWVEGTTVIYIGKAGGDHKKATLRSRLRTYMRFSSGEPAKRKWRESFMTFCVFRRKEWS
jgi:hypothetical protein